MRIQKKIKGRVGGLGWGGGLVGCEQRIEVFYENSKYFFSAGGGGGGRGKERGDQGRCERRSEVFLKFKILGGSGRGGSGWGEGSGKI